MLFNLEIGRYVGPNCWDGAKLCFLCSAPVETAGLECGFVARELQQEVAKRLQCDTQRRNRGKERHGEEQWHKVFTLIREEVQKAEG